MTVKWTSDISHWQYGVTKMWRRHTLMKILTAISDASLDYEKWIWIFINYVKFYKGLHPLTEGFCAVCSPISQFVPTLISCYNKFNVLIYSQCLISDLVLTFTLDFSSSIYHYFWYVTPSLFIGFIDKFLYLHLQFYSRIRTWEDCTSWMQPLMSWTWTCSGCRTCSL
jgi:hypothetical protein